MLDSALFLSLLFLFNGFFYARLIGSYINPVSILSFYWLLTLFLPLLIYPDGRIQLETHSFVFLCLATFSLPFYVILLFKPKRTIWIEPVYFRRRVRFFLGIYFLIGIVFFWLHLSLNNVSVMSWVSSPKEITAMLVNKKYASELIYSFYSKVIVLMMYPVAFLGGLMATLRGRSILANLVCCFTIPILFFIIFGDKGALFLVSFLYYMGWLVASSNRGEVALIRGRQIVYLLPVFICLFLLILFAFISRGVSIADLYSYFVSYSSGHIFAFNDWFSYFLGGQHLYARYDELSLPFGYYTFQGIYNLVGYPSMTVMGIYGEYFTDGFLTTNIYTIFRGLLYDFGFAGTLVFFFIFGWLMSVGYLLLCKYGWSVLGITSWYLFSLFVYSSYIISTFVWVTTIVSVGLIFVLLFAFLRKV